MRLLLLLALLGQGGCISEKRQARAASRVDLAIAYYQEGSEEAAIKALQEAAKLDPRNWRAQSALGVVYVAKGKDELAETAFKKAIHLNPAEAEVLVNYGAFLVRNNRPEEAVTVLEKALEDLDYRSPALILSNLSYALIQCERPQEAVARAREAVKRVPTLCEAHYHLGMAYEAAGDTKGALSAWREQQRVCPKESLGARLNEGCLRAKLKDPDAGSVLEGVVNEVTSGPIHDKAQTCLDQLGGT